MREGWEIKKLGDIADLQRGLTYSKGDEVSFSSKRVLRSNNIDLESSKLDLTELKYLREDFVIPEDRKVKENSIFICMSNGSKQHVGKVAFINDDIDYAYGGFMGLIVPQEGITPKYVFYSCLSPAYRLFLSSIGNGIGITNLRFTDLANFTLPVPPVQEQEKIVAELDCLTAIIEKKKQQLEELDKLAQSIFYDMFGDPIANEKGWKVKKLGEEFDVASGGTPSTKEQSYWDNGNIPWIGSNMCQNKVIYNNDGKFITKAGLEHSSARYFYKGYVLVALVGATIGKTALLQFDTTTNQNIAGISVPANKKYTSFFIFYLIQGLYGYFENIGEGKFKMANLSFVRALPIITPPLDLQNEFARKIEAIEKQKELIKKSIQETETLFNSRMDFWFNNKRA